MKKLFLGVKVLYQEICPRCSEMNLSGSKKFECRCGEVYYENKVETIKVVIPPRYVRKQLSYKQKQIVLGKQNNKCYWCHHEIGDYVYYKGKIKTIKAHFDHKIPFSYFPNNDPDNFVASCNICNLLKSNKIFEDEKTCRNYLISKWTRFKEIGDILENS